MKLLLVLLTASLMAQAEDKKAKPAAKEQRVKAPKLTLQYKGGTKVFNSPKLIQMTYSRHLEYISKGKKYVRDCKVGTKGGQHLVCTSPCSGGELKVTFERRKGFDVMKIPAFKIQPSMCDQTSRADDPWIQTKKELVFQLKKMGTK